MYCCITLNISETLPSGVQTVSTSLPAGPTTRAISLAASSGRCVNMTPNVKTTASKSGIFKGQRLCISIHERNIQLACACQCKRGCQRVRSKIGARDIVAALGKSARGPARSRRQVVYAHLLGWLEAINGVFNGIENSATDLVVGGMAT